MSNNLKTPEEMASFFDVRAEGYDDHMAQNVGSRFYDSIGPCVDKTAEPICVLDLGCGTGLEIKSILESAPNARITGVDLSSEMLEILKAKYAKHGEQISVRQDSYLTMDMGGSDYDYVVSAQTMHHLLHDTKRALYGRIRSALKPGGKYINADYMVSPEEEVRLLKVYEEKQSVIGNAGDGLYHIDIPFSVETETTILKEAGFREVKVVLKEKNAGILVATA